MKKYLAVLLMIGIILSCCACGTKSGAEEKPAVQDMSTPEAMYGHIDQMNPIDGVYKIWNAEGIKNIVNHPDGSFELLCNVDMQGAELAPIGTAQTPFTGKLNGKNFTVSNFTVRGGEEESFGFITVNEGTVQNFLIDGVTFLPNENAKSVGSLVGDNRGTVLRCTVTGTMDVEKTAQGASCGSAVGANSGSLANTVIEVDLNVTAPEAANVGGIVGVSTGGSVEYIDTNGRLDMTGAGKAAGLFAGLSTDTVFTGCAFVGASNTIDGKLFTNFTGNPDDDELVVAYKALWRDNDVEPMPENIAKMRDTIVQKMYDMGTIEWYVDKELRHDCQCGQNACIGVYMPGVTYIGMPYKHGSGSLTSFQYCLDENNFMNDWVYDMDTRFGYDTYIGSMCCAATEMAWWTVCNEIDYLETALTMPYYYPENGCIPVGEGWWEDVNYNISTKLTDVYVNSVSEQEWYNILAQTHRGDCLTNGIEEGYHTIMIASEPVIVRDQEGNINGDKSYLLTHEQCGGAQIDDEKNTWTTWRLNKKQTFSVLRGDWFFPFTCEELLTGEMETPECTILDGADGKLGLTTGIVKGNYFLESVTMQIVDSKGEVVLDQVMFPKAGKFDDANMRLTSLAYQDSYDMANFAMVLQDLRLEKGETYSYTISAHLATGDDFMLKTDSFVQGTAG